MTEDVDWGQVRSHVQHGCECPFAEAMIERIDELVAVRAGRILRGAQADVRHFHEAIGDPAPVAPTQLARRIQLRLDLVEEEEFEFEVAFAAGDMLAMIDALCDRMYVILGTAVEMGVDLEPFWHEVHASNMRKIGGPVRDDGKQLKPEGWKPPDLERVWRETYGDLPVPGPAEV